MIEEVVFQDKIIAIIVRDKFDKEGVTFFTPDDYSQQLAYMKHPVGKAIQAHVHNEVKREVTRTNEVLFIKRGRLRVDFYSDDFEYIESKILHDGDVMLLVSGGHGFKVLEDVEMLEVKQGPFQGEKDKSRFKGIQDDEVVMT